MVGNALAKKRSEEYLRQRENGFNLSGVHQERLPQYNALMDRNLRHHFESRPLQNHLNELGLIDQRGRIVDLDKQKSKLFIIDQEFKLAEDAERKKQREEEELRRRVQMKRHDALHNARQKEKLLQLKEEKKIAREIVQAAKGYNSVEPGQEDVDAAASTSAGETALSEMNAAFASCLSLVCPPIQYPPHCRFNPVRDAADTAEIEARLEEFFLHAKQLEQLFLNDTADSLSSMSLERSTAEMDAEPAGRQHQSELELEILNLEAELAEKNDLIEKYTEVVRGWEGKFKRLDHRMSPDRE